MIAALTDSVCQFFHGDFLNLDFKDWRDADVVFANSTCYDDELMEKIAAIAGRLFIMIAKLLRMHLFDVSCLSGHAEGIFFCFVDKTVTSI